MSSACDLYLQQSPVRYQYIPHKCPHCRRQSAQAWRNEKQKAARDRAEQKKDPQAWERKQKALKKNEERTKELKEDKTIMLERIAALERELLADEEDDFMNAGVGRIDLWDRPPGLKSGKRREMQLYGYVRESDIGFEGLDMRTDWRKPQPPATYRGTSMLGGTDESQTKSFAITPRQGTLLRSDLFTDMGKLLLIDEKDDTEEMGSDELSMANKTTPRPLPPLPVPEEEELEPRGKQSNENETDGTYGFGRNRAFQSGLGLSLDLI